MGWQIKKICLYDVKGDSFSVVVVVPVVVVLRLVRRLDFQHLQEWWGLLLWSSVSWPRNNWQSLTTVDWT
jgi:hypothetical protein